MVAIRRRKTKSTSVASSFLSNLTIRGIIIGVIVLQGIRLLWRAAIEPSNHKQDVVGGSSKQTILKDSLERLSDKMERPGVSAKHVKAHDIVQRRRKQSEPHISEELPIPNDHHIGVKQTKGKGEDIAIHPEEGMKHSDAEDDGSHQAQEQKHGDELMKKDGLSDSEKRSTEMVLEKHGTGDTNVGYVVDLAYERKYPAFRNDHSTAIFDSDYHPELERRVVGQLKDNQVSAVHACEKLVPISSQDKGSSGDPNSNGVSHRLEMQPKCHDEDTRLVVYNGADFPRHVCGHVVEPKSSHVVGEDCHFFPGSSGGAVEDGHPPPPPIHLLPLDNPPVSGLGMPPIQVVGQDPQSTTKPSSLESVACNIPCEWESNLLKDDSTPGDRFVVGTDWKITYSDRDPASDHNAQIERTAYRRNHYYATSSWLSAVPLSSFSFDKYDFRKAPAIDYDQASNAASSVLSEKCSGTLIRRQKWMASAQANLNSVHFYGKCQHNTKVPSGLSLTKPEDRIKLMKQDRIVLAYEESTEPYHVTSIVWEALLSGAVPAILGASNLEPDILPPNAALYASTYNSWDDFSKYVQAVADDKERWESFQQWRTDEAALSALEERFNFTRTSPQCRMCRWAYAKTYGLGWNHRQQTVQPNHIPHELCVATKSDPPLVAKPFRESWHMGDQTVTASPHDGTEQVTCEEQHQTATILGKMERWVWHHDGFTDMTFRPTSENEDGTPLVLQLQVNVLNHEGALFRDIHTLIAKAVRTPFVSSAAIQDNRSKVTVLTNFVVTEFRSPKTGVLELQIPTTSSPTSAANELKLRIITEDFNEVQDKLTEYFPSAYAEMAMKDFIDPIEVFYVASSE